MAAKLSDSELAQRVRASNRQRAQRQAERRKAAGLVPLNVWLSQSTRTALDNMAAANGLTLAATVADLLERATAVAVITTTKTSCAHCNTEMPAGEEDELFCSDCMHDSHAERSPEYWQFIAQQEQQAKDAENDTHTCVHSGVSDKAAIMNEIAALLNEGLSGAEIARRLNDSGRRTSSGTPFNGANLLRDYRAWVKKRNVE